MTRLVCSENGLHASIASYRADLFTSTSLSKDFDNSSCAQKFIMEISDKTKGNDLALECLSNILSPYVIVIFIRITNDCKQDDCYTEAGCSGHLCNCSLSLTWNTEVRIQPIRNSKFLGKFTHSLSFFFSRLRRKTKWFVGNCRALLQSRNSTSREAVDEWPSIDCFLLFLEFKYVIVTLA